MNFRDHGNTEVKMFTDNKIMFADSKTSHLVLTKEAPAAEPRFHLVIAFTEIAGRDFPKTDRKSSIVYLQFSNPVRAMYTRK